MTHPIQTTIDFQDSEPFRFECARCGALHDGIPSFGWDFPAQYLAVADAERERRVVLSDDACIIDNEWFFIRGCLEIPVRGYREPLTYGVWLSLSRDSFARYLASVDDIDRRNGAQYFGWLCTAIPGYPDTQLLKSVIHVRSWPTRPFVQLDPTDHPLALEQRNGVNPWRVQQIVERITHPRHR
ncbi:MAG TPA: DUF2199 domain-containing protein [Gemmatimonadaceae bacterium]|jgi:hypothetical protein